MKTLPCLLFILLIVTALQSQNCKVLDSAKFFHSVQFGRQIPAMFLNCAMGQKIRGEYEYFLNRDSLSKSCQLNYQDIFRFYTSAFPKLIIRTNKKGQLYFAALWTNPDSSAPADLTNPALPDKFTTIYNKLFSLYGKETTITSEKDSVLIKAFGASRKLTWICNDINLELKVTFAAPVKELNILVFTIFNRKYETMPEQVRLQ